MSIRDLYDLKQQLRYTTQEVSQRVDASQGSSTQGSRKSKASDTGDTTKTTKRRKINLIDDQFRVSSKSVAQQGQLFENMTFCVLESDFVQNLSGNGNNNTGGVSTVRKFTREDLIFSIKSQGGTVVASATLPECKIIAGSKRTMQLNNLIERGEKDVIDFSYIIECVNAGALLPLKRVHLLGMSAETKKSFRGTVDVFGDSYTEDVTPEELSKILASFDPKIASLERKLASSGPVGNVSAKAMKAAAGVGKDSTGVEEQKWQQRERQDELAVLKDFKNMRNVVRGTVDVFGDSYTEDVTSEELSKILASFDPKIASLERKIASSGPVGIVSAKAKKAAAGVGKDAAGVEEQKWQQRERQDELAVLKDFKNMRNVGWRALAEQYLPLLEERDPLYHSYNSLWQEGVVLYMDISADLGSPHPLTETVPAVAFINVSSSTNNIAGHNKSVPEQYLPLLEERDPLYHSYNSLWQEGVVLYMDVSEDLGSPHPLTEDVPAFAFSNPSSSTTSSSHNKSVTSGHVQSTRSPVRVRPPLVGGNITSGSSSSSTADSLQATYMHAVRHYAELHGATVADNLHSNVTHIVIRPDHLSRLGAIRDRMRQLRTMETQSFEKRL
eukprot:CAMPEP_0185013830 /NCGR_PEP_ID=MMETSP1098-20130426/99006_1 /TAXON_ID=89044 /ORGANISM="Spumella elongata, Strain CCAP 955/1" /LENGTH=612 /DNA_ID=CAMNT_0027542901 /DNA_START=79 /DNA_END=1913 /DNA_ORIENTATION=+